MTLNLCFTPCTKINSQWNTDPNANSKTIELLEENTGENLCDYGLGKDFLDMAPKVQSIKEPTHKLDFIKI